MCKKYGIKIAVLILLFLGNSFGQDIRVENVFVPQDSVDKVMNNLGKLDNNFYTGIVTYDLKYEEEQETLAVWIEFSSDSGNSWVRTDIVCTGDFGRVVKGENKKIRWEWYGGRTNNKCLIKVIASDILSECEYEPPQPPIYARRDISDSGYCTVYWLSNKKDDHIKYYDLYQRFYKKGTGILTNYYQFVDSTNNYDTAWLKINQSPDTTYNIRLPLMRCIQEYCGYQNLDGYIINAYPMYIKLIAVDSCNQESVPKNKTFLISIFLID